MPLPLEVEEYRFPGLVRRSERKAAISSGSGYISVSWAAQGEKKARECVEVDTTRAAAELLWSPSVRASSWVSGSMVALVNVAGRIAKGGAKQR